MPATEPLRRMMAPALIVLLVAVWLGGGVTVDSSAADESLQLLALPVLGMALWILYREGARSRLQAAALAVAALIALIPALQLLPLPVGWWNAVVPRQALAADLDAAGVTAINRRWTLAPAATEAALWSLLPALAAFAAGLALPAARRRLVIKAVLLLVLGNILFAFFQASLPSDSALRLYQDFDAGFGGLLANINHQATAMIVGIALAVGQAVHAWRLQQAERRQNHVWAWYAAFAIACFLLLPLSSSRAGMVLALPVLAATLVLCGAVAPRKSGHNKRSLLMAAALACLAGIGIYAAFRWVAVDKVEELRHTMMAATVAMGTAHAPPGSGLGSFVPVFEQAAPASLWFDLYINHAHNEYAQWWLEAGWLGVLAPAAALAVLGVAGWRIVRVRGRDGHAILAASCFVAIGAVLAHSLADFPLRTTTLMATTAALVGIMLAALADARSVTRIRKSGPVQAARIDSDTGGEQPNPPSGHRGVAPQPA